MVLVGHVTKEGALAGPRVLEHIVDTVLYFEGDTHSSFRLIRAIKNRFGAVNEIGVFAMTDKGLKGVTNPSAIFLSTHSEPVPGSCVLVTLEGTRPHAGGNSGPGRIPAAPARAASAWAWSATAWPCCWPCCTVTPAWPALTRDVFVNAVGGVRISEPAADLAVLLAIQSSLRGRARPRVHRFWEVGLAGEVRPCTAWSGPLERAAKLGFSIAVVPKANAPRNPLRGSPFTPSNGWRGH